MSDDAWALQQAVYAALIANTTLTDIAPVLDGAAQGQALPYVDLGEADVTDWSTKTSDGGDHLLTIHVWSNYNGKKQAWQIIEQIRETLHEAYLALTGHTLVLLRHTDSRVFRDITDQDYHGVVEFRALTQSA